MAWLFEAVAGPFDGSAGGVAWDGEAVFFSIIPQPFAVRDERILRLDPQTSEVRVFRRYTGRTIGLAFASDGRMFGAQAGGRRIIQFMRDGSTGPLPDQLDGRHHNQPTDLIVDRSGRIWFADTYNVTPAYGPPVFPPLEHASILRLQPGAGGAWTLSRVTTDTRCPRALALSPDEQTLYVADGNAERGDRCELLAYPIAPAGSVGERKVLHAFDAGERGIEGMCIDSDGNVVACGGSRQSGRGPFVCVFAPSGAMLETHPAPSDLPMRCAFGGADLATLFLTTGAGELYRCADSGRRGARTGG
jgi:gluconolactonase